MLTADVNKVPTALKVARILVVEDEELIRDTISLALVEEGYEVVMATDGRAALDLFQGVKESWETKVGFSSRPSERLLRERQGAATSLVMPPETEPGDVGHGHFDLVILDLMLPYINGLDLCRLIRREGDSVPILILSAKGSEMDRVVGLEVGADDYLSKPFGMRELIARCRALLRRSRHAQIPPTESVLRYQEITLHLEECRVTVRGDEISFSPKEFRILELFMNYPRRVWSREQLLERIWGPDFMGDSKTVDVHIRWLREKLEADPSHPKYLQTVRGFGYRFG
jgi:two-component system, OmpR family, phosphate regulon response regulator PhoB